MLKGCGQDCWRLRWLAFINQSCVIAAAFGLITGERLKGGARALLGLIERPRRVSDRRWIYSEGAVA
ncbi:hypothetical protein CKO23_18730 [Thiocystis violacea]|nr:hypothetical protein [Thiocystis violacea]